jgi:alkanesulfonate monooxygenase SsuD/methylene tetrahydromethanopterin reductase-like flavin-dependent oxidoreductase (luciferase family)
VWLGSWGSDAGMRRVARLGDGWLASAYNLGADEFRASLRERLAGRGRNAEGFATALGTMWSHIDTLRADDVLTNRLAPVVHRPVEQLRERLAFGTGQTVLDKVAAFRNAGVQWMFVWPVGDRVGDDVEQLHRFNDEVVARLRR